MCGGGCYEERGKISVFIQMFGWLFDQSPRLTAYLIILHILPAEGAPVRCNISLWLEEDSSYLWRHHAARQALKQHGFEWRSVNLTVIVPLTWTCFPFSCVIFWGVHLGIDITEPFFYWIVVLTVKHVVVLVVTAVTWPARCRVQTDTLFLIKI